MNHNCGLSFEAVRSFDFLLGGGGNVILTSQYLSLFLHNSYTMHSISLLPFFLFVFILSPYFYFFFG